MDRLVGYLLLFAALPFTMESMARDIGDGLCQCGAFRDESSEPVLERALPISVPCNMEGAERCHKLCIALAEAAEQSTATNLLCGILNEDVQNLSVAIKSRTCQGDEWTFTGLRNDEPICCVDGKSVPCHW